MPLCVRTHVCSSCGTSIRGMEETRNQREGLARPVSGLTHHAREPLCERYGKRYWSVTEWGRAGVTRLDAVFDLMAWSSESVSALGAQSKSCASRRDSCR
jgi:hypothetical protein